MENTTLWDRTKHTFERILTESQKATERVVDSLEELGGVAKARLEKARLERALFKKYAELGARLYDLAKQAALPNATPPQVLDDDEVKALLRTVGSLDVELEKVVAELSSHDDAEE
jgi:hypothetical protein